ncbi:MAG: hypothetical protein H6767_08980 [Candidatus Peribacteria bacterium]|nr:MAG: hypothetical protein H6767_08980 [Candidatus Peribacteria bacterium]
MAELFLLQPGKLISKTRFINSVW